MSLKTPGDAPVRTRPQVVDYAVYAIFARCVVAVLAAVAGFGLHDELIRIVARDNPGWSQTKVAGAVGSPGPGLVVTLVVVGLILVVAKYIRDGRNWARWTFVMISMVLTRDVFRVTTIFATQAPIVLRVLYTLVGLFAIAAIALMFVRDSNRFFRRSGVASGVGLGALFGSRGAANSRAANSHAAKAVSVTKPAPASRPGPRPPGPKSKSRRRPSA